VGPYVLGSLRGSEQELTARHVAGCSRCRDEAASLRELTAVMRRLSTDEAVDTLAEPSPDLYTRLRAQARLEVAARRRTKRLRRLGSAAAAVAVLAGTGVGLGVRAASTDHHPVYAAGAGRVHMSVSLATQASGTAITVTVSGLPEEEHCRLIAVAHDGSRDLAGTWTATYAGEAKVTGSTRIPQKSLDHLVLLGAHARQLVSVPV
jgi:anti-sigma factor RsiW